MIAQVRRLWVVVLACAAVACVDDTGNSNDAAADLSADLAMPLFDQATGDDLLGAVDLLPPYDADLTTPVFARATEGMWGGNMAGITAAAPLHYFATSLFEIFESTDGGISWSRLADQPALAGDDFFRAISTEDNATPQVVVSTANGAVFLRAANSGWQALVGGNDMGTLPAISILGIQLWRGSVYALDSMHVYRWDLANPGWQLVETTSGALNLGLYAQPKFDNRLWITRTTGLFSVVAPGNTPMSVRASTVRNAGYAATSFGGFKTMAAFLDNARAPYFYIDGTAGLSTCTATPELGNAIGVRSDGSMMMRGTTSYWALTSCAATPWTAIGPTSDITSMVTSFVAFADDNFAFSPKGIFRNTGTAIVDASTGIGAVSIIDFDAPAGDPTTIFAATDRGLYRRQNDMWNLLTPPGVGLYPYYYAVAISPAFSQHVIASVDDKAGLVYSANGGDTFAATSKSGDVFTGIAWDAVDPDVALACASGLVKRTTNGGLDWTPPVTDTGGGIDSCGRMVAHPQLANVFFAASPTKKVFVTSNRGGRWDELAPGQLPSGVIAQIAAVPDASDEVYVVLSGNALLRVTPSKVNSLYQPTDGAFGIAIDPLDTNRLYVVGRSSVNVIDKSGVGGPIDSAGIAQPWTAFVHPADRRQLWIGTTGHGVFEGLSTLVP